MLGAGRGRAGCWGRGRGRGQAGRAAGSPEARSASAGSAAPGECAVLCGAARSRTFLRPGRPEACCSAFCRCRASCQAPSRATHCFLTVDEVACRPGLGLMGCPGVDLLYLVIAFSGGNEKF
ncbi:uncharacterized protein LOC144286218 [Canis aureus]